MNIMRYKVISMREYNNVMIKLIDHKVSDSKQNCEDIAVEVAEHIISQSGIEREDIGVLLYVTQSPKFMTPSTSFYIHKELKLGIDCFQYDINQGSTGVFIGLQMIISLMQGFEEKKKGLLLMGDSNSQYGSCAGGILIEHTNEDKKIYIQNCSYGKYYKKYIRCKGKTILDDSFVSVGKQNLNRELQIVSDYAKMHNIQIDKVINFENEYQSATEIIKKIWEIKPTGDILIGTFGAGISVVIGIVHLNKDMYM